MFLVPALERLRQEDCSKLEAILGNSEALFQNLSKQTKMHIIPVLGRLEFLGKIAT